jgi:DNA repair protein RadC
VLTLAFDIRDKKKEHLICLHLDSRNALIKKETLSIGLLDKSIIHPREIFILSFIVSEKNRKKMDDVLALRLENKRAIHR